MAIRARLALCAGLIIAAATCGCVVARSAVACGPFGNPPATILGAVKPDCETGELLGPWKDGDGTDRYACLYEPASTRPFRKLPLLVYLHPSLFGAWTVGHTNLLKLQKTSSLGKDANATGFIVLAPQGRRTAHYYPWPDKRAMGWDNWYRQVSPAGSVKIGETVYPENADAATIDHFVAQTARTGKVDSRRVYVTGWSNGAAMGLLYALNRPDVAAAAIYSGPDPFGAFDDPCRQTPVSGTPASNAEVRIFNPRVPVLHVHNSCDIVGICPNDEKMAVKLRAAGISIDDVIVDSSSSRVDACEARCGADPNGGLDPLYSPLSWFVGLHRHQRWPSRWTPAMLEFLRGHPLQPAAVPF